jgi:hemerythrin superfamily protein
MKFNGKKTTKKQGNSIDILQILHSDHQMVAELFFQFSQSEDDAEQERIVSEIITQLLVHAQVEEELVYPAVRDGDESAEDMMDEADTEHHVVKFLMAELSEMSAGDDHYKSKVTVLKELVNHHVQEEEKEIFDKLEQSGIDLNELGEAVVKRKEELKEDPALLAKTLITSGASRAKTKKRLAHR